MAVNVTAFLNTTGYGVVGLNTCLALDRLGENPAVWPIGPVEADPEFHESIRKWVASQASYDANSPSLRIYHQFDLAQHVGSPRAAYPFFELNRFKPVERHHLQSQDIVFAPSQWAAEVLAKEGIAQERIKLARPGVDRSIFSVRDSSRKDGDPTVFLNIGKWELRKGHQELIQGFNKAFEKNDNVTLVMHCFNPCFRTQEELKKYNNEWIRFAKTSKLGDKIQITTERFQSQRQVADLMAQADCGVFPSKAEGWGLESAEMLAMGKYVILTDYSSHSEYMTTNNSYWIAVEKTEPAHDGVWFRADDPAWNGEPGEWAHLGEYQEDQLVAFMQHVHALVQHGDLGRNDEGVASMKEFTWENTAKEILNGLRN